MNSEYVLTYDLKILYCADTQLSSSCKELDLISFNFFQSDYSIEDLNCGFTLHSNEIETIAKKILNGKVGNELKKQDMDWIVKYENMLRKDMSILLNKQITYNYFVLKLRLLGFPEKFAREMMSEYYTKIDKGLKVPHQQILLRNINKFLSEKLVWIKSNLKAELKLEKDFFEKVIKNKFDLEYRFSFENKYKNDYLKLCENGIIRSLIIYNQTPSLLVRKKHNVSNLIPYILDVYLEEIKNILEEIYEKKGLPPNDAFISDLLKQVESYAKLYITLNFTKKI